MKHKRRIKLLSIFLFITIFICIIPIKASAESQQVIQRIYGSSRYETAAAISKETWNYTQNVIIASGVNFPDALAGVTLSFSLSAPILLTDKNNLNTSAITEIKRLEAENAYILGGTGAAPQQLKII